MFVSEDTGWKKVFIDDFQYKFRRFCNNTPILLSFNVVSNTVFVSNYNSKEIKKFDFDYSKSVKENIHSIKEWLFDNVYPVMYEIVEKKDTLSFDDLDSLLQESKITLEDASNEINQESLSTIKWVIEQVRIKRDEILVRNTETNQLFRYKTLMPVTRFLSALRKEYDMFEAFKFFKQETKLIFEVFPKDVLAKMKNN